MFVCLFMVRIEMAARCCGIARRQCKTPASSAPSLTSPDTDGIKCKGVSVDKILIRLAVI